MTIASCVVENKKFKVRASVAFVQHDSMLEIFNSNTREISLVRIENPRVVDIVGCFDGKRTLLEVAQEADVLSLDDFYDFVNFLNSKHALIEIDEEYDQELFSNNYRIINMLEEYCFSTSQVLKRFSSLETSVVLLFGLGAVGTWVTQSLAMTGARNFILVDDDTIEDTNLHRQGIYTNNDIGKFKCDVTKKFLEENHNCTVTVIKEKLDTFFFERHNLYFDLVINCADYPSVDATTQIIGKECMLKRKPHIIGGGYNLHLTLIGQAVIPGKTACVNCFDRQLKKINEADLFGVKRLERKSRKIGSFGPICGISASITALEATKILIGAEDEVINKNKRIEFLINEMDFSIKEIRRDPGCEWCGADGIYK